MAHVHGLSHNEIEERVTSFYEMLTSLIKLTAYRVRDNLGHVRVADAAPIPGQSSVSVNDLDALYVIWQQYVQNDVASYIAQLYLESAHTIANEVDGVLGFPPIDISAVFQESGIRYTSNITEPTSGDVGYVNETPSTGVGGSARLQRVSYQSADEYLRNASNRMSGVGQELWEAARDALSEGFSLGESIDELRERVVSATHLADIRAQTVARTEVISALNAGSLDQMRMYDSQFDDATYKTWLASHDGRTRLAHALADGQRVIITSKFMVGGDLLDRPGDSNGSADNVVNCRCTMTYDIGDPHVDSLIAASEASTRAMIALIPTNEDAERLVVDGGESVDELHVTLHYLGDAANYDDASRQHLIDLVTQYATSQDAQEKGPIESDGVKADGFALSAFNPTNSEKDTCIVLGLSGHGLITIHSAVDAAIEDYGSDTPDQHSPWVPHLTLQYTDDLSSFQSLVDRTGPITFDRVRVAFADQFTDIPLGQSAVAPTGTGYEEDTSMSVSVVSLAATVAPSGSDTQSASGNDMMPSPSGNDAMPSQSPPAFNPPAGMTSEPGAWMGVLAVEGVETGDGRMFSEGSLTWAEPWLPLRWAPEDFGAHDGAVDVARIDNIWRDENIIYGSGVFDLGQPAGVEAYRRVDQGFLKGVSIDPDSIKDADVELVFPAGQDPNASIDDGDMFGFPMPELTIFHAGRIRAATLVGLPAFVEAQIWTAGNVPPSVTVMPMPTDAMPTSGDDVLPTNTPRPNSTLTHAGVGTVSEELSAEMHPYNEMNDGMAHTVVASGGHTITIQDVPPVEWFDEPLDVDSYGALTITDAGRVYGYLAPRNVAHRSFADKRVTVPMMNVDYSRFMGGETIVAGGSRIPTGVITMNCGHASINSNVDAERATEHYDNTCSMVASVRVGENRQGVWIAGALLPGVTADEVSRMMSSRLSGDWRAHRERTGWRELTAALLVPVPGFPMAREKASVRIEYGQLVAAAVPVHVLTHRDNTFSDAVNRIAKGIGRDPASRMKALRARVHN